MTKKLYISILLFIYAAIGMNVFAAADEVKNIPVVHDELYGAVSISLPTDEFRDMGYAYGDSVNVTFSNGYSIQDLPYYNGYYVRPGEAVLCGVSGKDNMVLSINYGDDLWVTAGLSENESADISLYEAGKYLDVQNANDLYYVEDRSAYSSDAVFANFRSMKGGRLKKDFLFRSASPCNNNNSRAVYADRLARDAGVNFVLNLADDEDDIRRFAEKDDFNSPYYLSLYEDGKVALTPVSYNYNSADFRDRLIAGLKTMAAGSGPYLIHCTQGKDRTGFVCMLLEALAGCSFDEMTEDYMLTFQNYYGISEDSDPEKYRLIEDINFIPMLCFLTGEDEDALPTADYAASAERYLSDGGMSDDEIRLLKSKISD